MDMRVIEYLLCLNWWIIKKNNSVKIELNLNFSAHFISHFNCTFVPNGQEKMSRKKRAIMKCRKHDCQLFARAFVWNSYDNCRWMTHNVKNIQIKWQQPGGIGMWHMNFRCFFFQPCCRSIKRAQLKFIVILKWKYFGVQHMRAVYSAFTVAPSLFCSVTVCVPCICQKKARYLFVNCESIIHQIRKET